MILKSAVNSEKFVNNLFFTSNARTAWEHILNSMKHVGIVPNVLMPSYIGYTEREGSGVFDPILAQDAGFEFYELKRDLSINIDTLKKQVKSKKFNALLVIHYFGFCRNDMDYIKTLCKEYQIILIEDCAHAFQIYKADALLGNYGDFSFYSLHKYLPTNSGGLLKSDSDIVPVLPLTAGAQIDLLDLIQYSKSRFHEIAIIRRSNYFHYFEMLSKNPEIDILYNLEDGDIPQTFPIKVKNNNREKLYFYLMKKNAPTTALYYRLIEQIPVEKFPLSYEISSEILNLPVHQDTTTDDVLYICDLINKFYTYETRIS